VPDKCQHIAEHLGLSMSLEGIVFPYREAILSDFKGDIKKRWYVTYYVWSEKRDELVRKRCFITDDTKKERYAAAKDLIVAINEELRNGAVVDAKEPVISNTEISGKTPIKVACEYFLAKRGQIVGTNTKRGYTKDVNSFLAWAEIANLSNSPLSKFGTKEAYMFSDYLDSKVSKKTDKSGIEITKVGVAKKTFSNFIATMRTMWSFYIERKILKENPFMDVKKRRGGSSQHVPYSPEQVRLYKTKCLNNLQDPQLWLFVNFIYYCFLRPREEAQQLQVKHILKRTIIVPGEIAKNNLSEHIRIPKGLETLIQEYKLRDFPPNHYIFSNEKVPGIKHVGINYFYERNKKVLELAGLADQEYDLYGWKHTGVVSLYQATKDIKLIQVQCRHKDISTTDKYLRDLGLFLDEDVLDRFPDPIDDHKRNDSQ
jgi:integrase